MRGGVKVRSAPRTCRDLYVTALAPMRCGGNAIRCRGSHPRQHVTTVVLFRRTARPLPIAVRWSLAHSRTSAEREGVFPAIAEAFPTDRARVQGDATPIRESHSECIRTTAITRRDARPARHSRVRRRRVDEQRRLVHMASERRRGQVRAKERHAAPEVSDERVGLHPKKPESLLRKLLRSPPRRSGSDPG